MPAKTPLYSASLVAVIGLALAVGALGCDSKQRGEQQTPARSDDSPSQPQGTEQAQETVEPPEASDLEKFTADIDGDGPLFATIETSEGNIRCDLHEQRAPLTVTNFVGLALGEKTWRNPESGELERQQPYYDDVKFHRVIPNFMIQAGDQSGTGTEGPGYTIPDEFHPELRHDKAGVLSMANRGEPDTSGAQWFILEMPAPHLDERHSVFGQCEDLDVVRKISRMPTGPDNRPQSPPIIETITIKRGTPDSFEAVELKEKAPEKDSEADKGKINP